MSRQTGFQFLFPTLSTPLWFVKSESNAALLSINGENERIAALNAD
jgi:hypothetical protein